MKKLVYILCVLMPVLVQSCHKVGPDMPGKTDPVDTTSVTPEKPMRELEITLSATMPNLRMADGLSSCIAYWSDNPNITIINEQGETFVLTGNTSAGNRLATFKGKVKAGFGTVSLSGRYPDNKAAAPGTLQNPLAKACDPSFDYMSFSISESVPDDATTLEIQQPAFIRMLSYICLKPGSSLQAYSGDKLRYVEFCPDGQRPITLDYRGRNATIGSSEIWVVIASGTHSFSAISISTDKRQITLRDRQISAVAGKVTEYIADITSADKVTDNDPAPVENGKSVWYYKDCTMAGAACADNFLCLVNGHSYSPYTLRYLDPFTLLSANPNGWSTSTANKLANGTPELSDEEYRSVKPYILFYTATNTIYGPASKYIAMQAYSYDAMLFVSQMGTPALMFRRLETSGADSSEQTVAKWVRNASIDNISTATDGTVTIKSGSSTVSRNFKVDKTIVQYDAKGDSRDTWKQGDVIMIQQLGRYGNITDKEYLKTGMVYIKQIVSDSYDSKTGDFKTMDHYSRLILDCYWEK